MIHAQHHYQSIIKILFPKSFQIISLAFKIAINDCLIQSQYYQYQLIGLNLILGNTLSQFKSIQQKIEFIYHKTINSYRIYYLHSPHTRHMLPSNEDKKMLIESMKKLTNHISNNYTRQKDIFQSLSKQDVLKIFTNLNDQNEYLRRISGLLLIELLYNNSQIRSKLIKMLQIYPSFGRICLNGIPQTIQKYPSTFKKCIQLIKSPLIRGEQQKMCWTINLDRKVLQIQYLQYKKYSSFTFLDPNKNIFGITFLQNLNELTSLQQEIGAQNFQKNRIASNNMNNNINKINDTLKPSLRLMKQQNSPRQNVNYKQNKQIIGRNSNKKLVQRQRSSQSQRSSRSKNSGFGLSNNSFYKNYLDARNRLKESPVTYKETYEKKQSQRPNTSRSYKEELMSRQFNERSSIDYQNKISHLNANNNSHISTNRQKVNSTSHSPYLYTQLINSQDLSNRAQNPYNKTILTTSTQFKDRPKINSQSMQLGTYLSANKRPSSNVSNHQSNYIDYKQRNRGMNTQRKTFEPNSFESEIKKSLIIGNKNSSSINSSEIDRYKMPQTAKNSYASQHQKFYKRVKEILKK